MRSYVSTTLGVAGRILRTSFRSPALLLPPLLAPMIFLAVFAGGLQALGRAPGFDFSAGYTSFELVFILLQAAAFNGAFAGFSLARDFETGFTRRLLLAAPSRTAIVAGYVVSSMVRTAMSIALLFAVGIAVGAEVEGSALEVAGLVAIALAFSVATSLWAVGLAMRLRTMQAAPAVQIPVFLSLFVAPTFVPVGLLTGWIHGAATYNPVTYLLQSGRGFISGQPADVALAFGLIAGLVAGLGLWAVRGLRRAEAG